MTRGSDDEAPDLGPVPPETLALWIDAVATMDALTLESFVGRMRRTWAASELVPLEAAVRERRRVLEQEAAASGRAEQ